MRIIWSEPSREAAGTWARIVGRVEGEEDATITILAPRGMAEIMRVLANSGFAAMEGRVSLGEGPQGDPDGHW